MFWRLGQRVTLLAVCTFGLALDAAHADVHKCVDAKGQVEYRDGPCGASGTSVKVVKTPHRLPAEDEPIFEEDSEESAPEPDEVTPERTAPAPAVLAPPGARSY